MEMWKTPKGEMPQAPGAAATPTLTTAAAAATTTTTTNCYNYQTISNLLCKALLPHKQ